jgi:hypothetical protein
MSARPYHRYLPYGPPRPVPRLIFMPFPGHQTMEWIIAREKREPLDEQNNEDGDERA